MISIIVSSYKKEYFSQFEQNINETIGIPYEIIKIDNPGLMGLCEAYNKGTQLAKYDILCFSHEDINIKTVNWGKKVIEQFNDKSIGLLGVAGSKHKTYMSSGWDFAGDENKIINCFNLIQCFKNSNRNTLHSYQNPDKQSASNVVVIDGVWFCTRRKICIELPFDQNTFTGFHCYDIDFSLQVFLHYKVMVTYEVLLEHFSEGNFDKTWLLETFKLHNKWKMKLPVGSIKIDKNISRKVEFVTFHNLLYRLLIYNLPLKPIYSYIWLDLSKSVEAFGIKYLVMIFTKRLLGYYRKSRITGSK